MRRLSSLFIALSIPTALSAQNLDDTPRTAIMSAFPPEIVALQEGFTDKTTYTLNGVTFTTGQFEGKPVVMFMSGVSMVNAAMTTQLALDHFAIKRIVFSGIAGGVNPELTIGAPSLSRCASTRQSPAPGAAATNAPPGAQQALRPALI